MEAVSNVSYLDLEADWDVPTLKDIEAAIARELKPLFDSTPNLRKFSMAWEKWTDSSGHSHLGTSLYVNDGPNLHSTFGLHPRKLEMWLPPMDFLRYSFGADHGDRDGLPDHQIVAEKTETGIQVQFFHEQTVTEWVRVTE